MRYPNQILRVSWLVVLLCPLVAEGGSFSLNEQSVSGLGTAYAGGAAQAGDASTLYFNPAGIVLLDQGELQLGAQVIIPRATFSNQDSRYVLPGTPFDGLPLTGGNGGDWARRLPRPSKPTRMRASSRAGATALPKSPVMAGASASRWARSWNIGREATIHFSKRGVSG